MLIMVDMVEKDDLEARMLPNRSSSKISRTSPRPPKASKALKSMVSDGCCRILWILVGYRKIWSDIVDIVEKGDLEARGASQPFHR